jgi:hypothetical protein
MALRYDIIGDYPKMMKAEKARLAKAATATMRGVQDIIKRDGRAAIGAGGFSSRFQNAFRVNLYPSSGDALNPVVFAYHKVPWAGQFEDPQPVSGHPLLWLPIDANLPLQARGKRWTPKDFTNQIGPLRSGKRGSKPLLFGQVRVGKSGGVLALPSKRGNRHFSKQDKEWRPVFVGVSSVTDPKRFDISAVVAKADGQIDALYAKAWEESDRG